MALINTSSYEADDRRVDLVDDPVGTGGDVSETHFSEILIAGKPDDGISVS
jgi:hypothetical protein